MAQQVKNHSPIQFLINLVTPQKNLGLDSLEHLLPRADGWVREENLRKQTYRELLGSGDRVRLMQMVRALYLHKDAQASAGKKIHMCDENFLRDAEKQLISEVCVVLNMEPDLAKQFLRTKLREM